MRFACRGRPGIDVEPYTWLASRSLNDADFGNFLVDGLQFSSTGDIARVNNNAWNGSVVPSVTDGVVSNELGPVSVLYTSVQPVPHVTVAVRVGRDTYNGGVL